MENTLATNLKIEIGLFKEALSRAASNFEDTTGFKLEQVKITSIGNEDDKFGSHYVDVNLMF